MGVVYRATDTRLNRTVAVKVLPPSVAADPDRRERFDREAQAIAALNHPHICTLYDVVSHADERCLVLEYLEGETLAARLARGPLTTDEALRIAGEMASALTVAHRAGIVHRDIKPANVFLVRTGSAWTAKLLDFGLAKATAPAIAGAQSILPTTPAALTAQGTILGTFQYMAPEQLEGIDADARSDIFAFGCVLYEMLRGEPPFAGKSSASLISSIMAATPKPISTTATIPAALERIVMRCLAKDPDERWQSIADVRAQLQWVTSSAQESPAVSARPRRAALPWSVAAIAVVAAAGFAWRSFDAKSSPIETPRHLYMSVDPSRALNGAIGISNDGLRVSFQGSTDGLPELFVRTLAEPQAISVAAHMSRATDATAFSPDGSWLVYDHNGRLLKVPAAGGASIDLCSTGRGSALGIAFATPDLLVFGVDEPTPTSLRKLPIAGGTPQALTTIDPASEVTQGWPVAVPGGKSIVMATMLAAAPNWNDAQVDVVSLDTGARRPLFRGGIPLHVLPTGHLIFRRGPDVFAVPFDIARGEVHGTPTMVLSSVGYDRSSGVTWVAVADAGTIVYVGDFGPTNRSLVWLDRVHAAATIAAPPKSFADPRVSPDGQRLAFEATENGDDLWVLDLRRGTTTRMTFDPGEDETPVWSPDGKWIAYSSSRAVSASASRSVLRRASDGTGPEETLLTATDHIHVEDWTRDGRSLLLSVDSSATKTDIWLLPLDGSAKASPLLKTPYNERDARVSPDGRWIAYDSDETGRNEVYIQRFPSLGGKIQVSVDGGSQPVWSRDGRQLFFRSGNVMSVSVGPQDPPQLGTAAVVGEDLYYTKGLNHTGYDAAPDGRLVFARDTSTQSNLRFVQIIEHWTTEVLQRAPATR